MLHKLSLGPREEPVLVRGLEVHLVSCHCRLEPRACIVEAQREERLLERTRSSHHKLPRPR